MLKIFKSKVFYFIFGAILFGSIGVYATNQILASSITYKNTTVDQVLDDLYTKANGKKFCILLSEQYGAKGNIGSKYVCNLGDGVSRNFYILKVDGNNVKMIMEKNLSDEISGSARTMDYTTALNYLKSGGTGYSTISAWTNVGIENVDLPDAQDIANAGNITLFDVTDSETDWSFFGVNSQSDKSKNNNYAWLFNYLRTCKSQGYCEYETENNSDHAYGYWAKTRKAGDDSKAWGVFQYGNLGVHPITRTTDDGVRPVITLSKSNLAG